LESTLLPPSQQRQWSVSLGPPRKGWGEFPFVSPKKLAIG
jgi:hypothetical protein